LSEGVANSPATSHHSEGNTVASEAQSFMENQNNYPINYSIIVLFCTLGASLLISCSDLISMYLSIELQSFSLYVLSTLYKNSELSTSAGLKYFLLGGLSSCLILFGAGLVYAYTGLTNFESIYSFLSIYSIEINNNFFGSTFGGTAGLPTLYPFLSEEYSIVGGPIFLGFIFIFVGFLFKISAAPFHN
jgi:NADH-ubiquinone oxidoreductase chain 2